MASNVTKRAMFGILLALGCSSESNGGNISGDRDSTAGGYTGLGKYTGVSGVYGSGVTAVGGLPNGSGGITASVGGNGLGSASGAGPALAGSGGGTSKAGGGSGGSTALGGSTATGGRSSTSTGGRSGSSSVASGGNGPSGGVGMAGSSGATTFTWPTVYNPAGLPSVASGRHSPGTNCMSSACHATTQATRAFAFGGTVYRSDGTPAANVQLAVKSGSTTVTTYSATNGNFWLPLASAPSLNWATATVRIRNGNGELAKLPGTAVNAACNSCHDSALRITAP